MNVDLIKTRVVAFFWGLGTLIVGAIVTAILSVFTGPEFQALVNAHFGEGVTASLIFLVVQQVVSHLRNVSVVKNAELGGVRGGQPPVII